MRIHRVDRNSPKGWYEGPWNSDLELSLGFANEGIHEPHLHTRITEIYLIACGASRLRVERREFDLAKGDVIVIEPGEAHTFTQCSPDYLHFVIHTPGLSGDAAAADKVLVDPSRLGL